MAQKSNNKSQRSVAHFFVKTKLKETFINSFSQSNRNSEETSVLQNTNRSIYIDCLDEEISTIENNNCATDTVDESSSSAIYDQSCDEFSSSLDAVGVGRRNSMISNQISDKSSNSSDADAERRSSSVISNYVCDNRECLELKAKYDKLKQAYAKSLTVSVSNMEKIHKYEKEVEELKTLKETVSNFLKMVVFVYFH